MIDDRLALINNMEEIYCLLSITYCLIPSYCTVKDNGKDCVNPPVYIISIQSEEGEYLIGVVCSMHRDVIDSLIRKKQDDSLIPNGIIKFEELKYVGTDCISKHTIELDKYDD
jgi:hypothetical protein